MQLFVCWFVVVVIHQLLAFWRVSNTSHDWNIKQILLNMNKWINKPRSVDPQWDYRVLFPGRSGSHLQSATHAVSQTYSSRNTMWGTDSSIDQEAPFESHTHTHTPPQTVVHTETHTRTHTHTLEALTRKWLIHDHMKNLAGLKRKRRWTERGYMCNLQYVMSLLCSCKHQQSKGRTASRTQGTWTSRL